MLELAARDERARLDERLDDGPVRVAGSPLVSDDALALETGRVVGESAVLVDRVGNAGFDAAPVKLQRIGRPELEILAPMTWRGMDEARARVLRDMVACKQGNGKRIAALKS